MLRPNPNGTKTGLLTSSAPDAQKSSGRSALKTSFRSRKKREVAGEYMRWTVTANEFNDNESHHSKTAEGAEGGQYSVNAEPDDQPFEFRRKSVSQGPAGSKIFIPLCLLLFILIGFLMGRYFYFFMTYKDQVEYYMHDYIE